MPRENDARFRVPVVMLGALLAVGLTGCELPDVTMSPSLATEEGAPSAAEETKAAPTRAPVAAPVTPVRPAGDLDTGTLTRALAAGDRTVVIDYWTAEKATEWGADGTKNIQLSARVEGGGAEHMVKVTRFAATADDGTTRSPVAEDRGEFALTPPYSYTTAMTLLPSPEETAELVLYVQFDLLVETEPGSEVFFRQTVLDSLRLPLSEEISR